MVYIQKVESVWITANAGSGKTTYLTKRVVTLLLLGVVPERICCITYTKAAASEMRHRVLAQLRALLLMDEAACAEKIAALLGRAATPAETARARHLFGAVLDSPTGGLQLTTVHGFCQSILRKFPLEAGINPHFAVLEETAADRLIAAERNRLLQHYKGDHPQLNAALEIIASRASEARFDQYITAIISKRGAWEQVWRGQAPAQMRSKLMALHDVPANTTEANLFAAFTQCVDAAAAAVIRSHLPQLVDHEKEAEKKMGRMLAAWLEVEPDLRTPLIDGFCDVFLTKEQSIRKSLLNKKEFPEGAPLRQVVETLAQIAYRFRIAQASLCCAEETYAVAVLARELLGFYARAKETLHALDYDDLIGKTRELFANPSMLGWVMSKLDHRIDHLLVDEAQDTSGEQWAITSLLVEELIAANDGVGSANLPRSLLVVGDEKQSIYSFQGAAPELFAGTNQLFTNMLQQSPSPLRSEALSHSYRSAEAVLKLVNHMVGMPEIAHALGTASAEMPHLLVHADRAGSIALYPPICAPEREHAPPLTMPTEYQLSQSAAQLLAEEVAGTISGWLKSEKMLENKGRPMHAGDILVLVQKRTPFVLPLIRALERQHVPVAGMDRLTLSGHLAVRDLLALMRWALNVSDDLALAQVLRSPLIGMSDDDLRALCVDRKASLWAAMDGHEVLEAARDHAQKAPYDFLTHILEVMGTRRQFAERFGEEVHEVLDELKAQAAAMPEEAAQTLANFYDWMSGSSRQIKREQESGEQRRVRIMTVHGAKGLEAPVVLLVDTTRIPNTQKEIFFFAEDERGQLLPALSISDEAKLAPMLVRAKQAKSDALVAEYYRLLYVALTRACDELHIWGTATAKGAVNARSWYALAAQAMQTLGAVEEQGALRLRDVRAEKAKITDMNVYINEKTKAPDWILTAAKNEKIIPSRVSPSQMVQENAVSAYVESGGANSRARGVCIHRLLELVTAEQGEEEIARLAALVAPEWSVAERSKVAVEVHALMAAERWIWQFPSHAEVNIAGHILIDGAPLAVAGQIDRLIETDKEIIVLDYKTGRHVPENQYAISMSYQIQMKTYQALLQSLRPDKPVRSAILWTAAPRLMWCDEVVAAAPWGARLAS